MRIALFRPHRIAPIPYRLDSENNYLDLVSCGSFLVVACWWRWWVCGKFPLSHAVLIVTHAAEDDSHLHQTSVVSHSLIWSACLSMDNIMQYQSCFYLFYCLLSNYFLCSQKKLHQQQQQQHHCKATTNKSYY